ncbi:G/U mismatch-specific uracil DNA glycosylase [Candida viswanathii]|uniref:G/U mismatch-specific uracil DNA glycosylase n=1 Tax=Candida viswanathii TaxID=5486 RepID=A0A367XX16_9ASCO|nr:G/U mismatch-specific uracil DNA glycosylase [Candida viswanathii]
MTKTLVKRGRITKRKKVLKKEVVLPHLKPSLGLDLEVLFVGFNAGEKSAIQQHRYAHHTNQFWKLFNESRLLEKVSVSLDSGSDKRLAELLEDGCQPIHDYELVNYGVGFTSLVTRSTKTTLHLSMTEKLESVPRLLEEFRESNAANIVIVGKGILDIIVTHFTRKQAITFKLTSAHFTWGEMPRGHEDESYSSILASIYDSLPERSRVHVLPDTSGLVRHMKYEEKLVLWKDLVDRL